jgi:hypothetical protein
MSQPAAAASKAAHAPAAPKPTTTTSAWMSQVCGTGASGSPLSPIRSKL